jgi:surface antigen
MRVIVCKLAKCRLQPPFRVIPNGGITAPCAWTGATTGACVNPADPKNTNYWYDWGLKTCPTGDSYCTPGNQINGYYLYDNWGYGFRNCVSYVAWKLNSLGVDPKYFKNLGDGGSWYTNAQKYGLVSVGTTPKVGAAAVVPGQHVAYVSAVNNDGTITVQEYNHDEKGDGDTWSGLPLIIPKLRHRIKTFTLQWPVDHL